ncbi:MAG: hypothetical protein U0105_00895 [Candidatus Obscuribacterales bacterium]
MDTQETFHATTDGLAIRSAMWAATASWGNPLEAQCELLSRCGSTGKQLVQRLSGMQKDGWIFESVKNVSDVAYHADAKMITFWHNPAEQLSHAVGAPIENPTKVAAAWLAHEVGHHDGIILYDLPPGHRAEPIMAKRALLSEARAYMSEAFVSQCLGVQQAETSARTMALRINDLGGNVFDTHYYPSWDSLSRSQAVSAVNRHLFTHYAEPLVSPTGKLLPFDINKGTGDNIHRLPCDPLFAEDPAVDVVLLDFRDQVRRTADGGTCAVESTHLLTSGKWQRMAGKLGLLGVAVTVTDVFGAYNRGMNQGHERLVQTGINWFGYEGGSAAAGKICQAFPTRYKIPLVILGGIAGTFGVQSLEQEFGVPPDGPI